MHKTRKRQVMHRRAERTWIINGLVAGWTEYGRVPPLKRNIAEKVAAAMTGFLRGEGVK